MLPGAQEWDSPTWRGKETQPSLVGEGEGVTQQAKAGVLLLFPPFHRAGPDHPGDHAPRAL